MIFEENKSLKYLNTFGFDHSAQFYCEPHNTDELQEALAFARDRSLAVFMLGAGSNIVLSRDIAGLTIRQRTGQIRFSPGRLDKTLVKCDAGVNWHQLVLATLGRDLYGLENLSLIPGDVGAAPIQNIGAYGVELCDILVQLTALDMTSSEIVTFSQAECLFGYRDSIFKQSKQSYAIISIEVALHNVRNVNTSYNALAAELEKRQLTKPNAIEISNAVCHIRQRKLPDPSVIGNAGSFFKNPIISSRRYQNLKVQWPELPVHRANDDCYKVPAAWLIETAGWKGKRVGNVGVHSEQALVLVHYGNGSGTDLLTLANRVKDSVRLKFGILLEQEPGVI